MQGLVQITKRQDKINSTIAKVVARLEKLQAMSLEQYAKKKKMTDTDLKEVEYWYDYDVFHLKNQIENNVQKLEEAKRLDQKESDRINKEAIKVIECNKLLNSLPEVLKKFLADSIECCYQDMLKKKERLQKRLEEYYEVSRKLGEMHHRGRKYCQENESEYEHLMGLRQSLRLNSFEQSICRSTEEQLYKDCKESCENDVIDLVNRVYYKIGDIADCSGLHYCHNEINGIIRSKDGEQVTVNSILAGGYNIQRLHIRTLVN